MGKKLTHAEANQQANRAHQKQKQANKKRGSSNNRSDGSSAPDGSTNRNRNRNNNKRRKTNDDEVKGQYNQCGQCIDNEHEYSNCWFNKFNKQNKLENGKVPDNLLKLLKNKGNANGRAKKADSNNGDNYNININNEPNGSKTESHGFIKQGMTQHLLHLFEYRHSFKHYTHII